MIDWAAQRRSFIDTGSFVFLVYVLLVVFGAVRILPVLFSRVFEYPLPGLIAVLVWTVYAAILLFILYSMQAFERRSAITVLGAFIWGAVVVTGIATTASPAMAGIVSSWLGPELADWVPAIAAPLTEEPLKMLGVVTLALVPGARVRTTLDGLFYGLVVGLGFEVVESLLYTTDAVADEGGTISVVFSMFVLRGVIGGLWSHPTFSGISGAGVGFFAGSPRPAWWRFLVAFGALLLAIALHGLFNSPLLTERAVPGAIIKGIPALLILLLVLKLARDEERDRFEQAGALEDGLVSDEERRALVRRSTRKKAIRALTERSGPAAGLALDQLQTAQVDLVETVIHDGVDTSEYHEAVERVRRARESLADLV